jgi:hypothetical protein
VAGINYPAKLSIDYPDRKLDRLTTFFRLFMVIPILIILYLILGMAWGWSQGGWQSSYSLAGLLVLPTILMILFRRKYPRWWFDWNLNITKFCYRIFTYMSLLTDVYPSTDEEQSVHIDISYPNVKDLSRWLPLVKWIMAIPHYIILFFLCIAAEIIVIIAWFVILFTGKYPRDMFNFVVDVYRWYLRVIAYAHLLVTDKYPPFSLNS